MAGRKSPGGPGDRTAALTAIRDNCGRARFPLDIPIGQQTMGTVRGDNEGPRRERACARLFFRWRREMKAKTLSVLAGASAPLILTGSASAGFVGLKTVSKETGFIPGVGELFVCNVYAVFDRPDDEMIAVAGTSSHLLNIFVKQGKFYQDPEGAPLTAPFLQFLPGASGALAYDSFITIGTKTDDLFSTLDDVSVTPGFACGGDAGS